MSPGTRWAYVGEGTIASSVPGGTVKPSCSPLAWQICRAKKSIHVPQWRPASWSHSAETSAGMRPRSVMYKQSMATAMLFRKLLKAKKYLGERIHIVSWCKVLPKVNRNAQAELGKQRVFHEKAQWLTVKTSRSPSHIPGNMLILLAAAVWHGTPTCLPSTSSKLPTYVPSEIAIPACKQAIYSIKTHKARQRACDAMIWSSWAAVAKMSMRPSWFKTNQ